MRKIQMFSLALFSILGCSCAVLSWVYNPHPMPSLFVTVWIAWAILAVLCMAAALSGKEDDRL